MLLPQNHHLSVLVVRSCHEKVHHGGIKETLAEVRNVCWIPKGTQFVGKILRQCVTCKKIQVVIFRPPQPAHLPETRITETAAFTHVGVDFAGPVYVKEMTAYICLFRCATSRALHVELTLDLSPETVIRFLRRFSAGRGTPAKMNMGITWKFILEKALWWGGYYERMVKLVKQSLRKVLGRDQLRYEKLMTVPTEIEGVLNSRPITYVYPDLTEEPLTPST